MLAASTGGAGFALAETAAELSRKTGLSQGAIGAVFAAVTTSLPELVTSIAAVRQGALTLAVGGIIGGNAFDVLFLAFADLAYRGGSIYQAMTERHVFLTALSIANDRDAALGPAPTREARHRRHRFRERSDFGPLPGRGGDRPTGATVAAGSSDPVKAWAHRAS